MEVLGLTVALEESTADLWHFERPGAATTEPGLSSLKRDISISFSSYGQNPEVFIQSLHCSHAKQVSVTGIKWRAGLCPV